jgi:TonB family protein
MDTSFVVGWLAGTLLPLGAIWLLFRLVLRGERCFGYNRALLLLAPVVAIMLPLLPRPNLASWLAPTAAPIAVAQVVALPTASVPVVPAPGWQPGIWLIWLYLLGVLVSLGCLAYRYVQLRRITRLLPREPQQGYTLAYTGGRLPTSSFGRIIFWDETAGLTPSEATAVLAHELVHVRQGHSFEVLWLEVWRALLWFNPFGHLLLPALRLTHELLADSEAMLLVASPADALAPAYPSLLARLAVRRVAGPEYSSLVQSFAFSFTLTRIAMLQNQIPVRRWKQWLALPLLGGVFLGASQVVAAQTTPASVATQKQVPPVPAPPTPSQQGKAPAPATSEGEHVYTYVEQMPALPTGGGMGGIIKQIQDNLVYPSGQHQEGRVFASFTVGADGEVRDTRIVKGLAPAYDDAVIAAIRKLSRFVPGVQSGQPVAVGFTVPVMFKEKP